MTADSPAQRRRIETRPAITEMARFSCEEADRTGQPCHECMQLCRKMLDVFLRELPSGQFTASQLIDAVKIGGADA